MTCTWEFDDRSVCGKPADGFRVKWLPKKRVWYFCPLHLATVRRMAPAVLRLYRTATHVMTS